MRIASYPSILNLGHKQLEGFFVDPVLVQEKIDGSQISFGLYEGKVHIRSKGQDITDVCDNLFSKARNSILELGDKLQPGWTYRGEYLAKPKHNTLAYDRIPNKHIIIYDIDIGDQNYLKDDAMLAECNRLGLEAVPTFLYGRVSGVNEIRGFLEKISCLGGQKIEGVVCKNYAKYGPDHKVLMAKYVSDKFRELHSKTWKNANPGPTDIKQSISDSLRTPARWDKAVQHLRDAGVLKDSPEDIAPLMKELSTDLRKECVDYIKDTLFNWAWGDIQRAVSRGFPEWYKEQLANKQFDS